MVHHAAQALTRTANHRRIGLIAAAMTLGALLLTSCGGSGSERQIEVGPNVGAPINLADCQDWKQANTEERLGTIQQLKGFAGGPIVGNNASSPSGRGAVLTDKQAYDLFENYCSQSFAAGFKLYKLYERAAAFAGQPPQ